MGEELKQKYNAEIELIAGSNGVYDITVDGKMIFSKSAIGRFPDSNEIASKIKSL